MFSSGSGTLMERKSTKRYQFYSNSPDGKLLFNYLAPSGHNNSLNKTFLWFGKNKARHPKSETLSCSETNPAANINSLQQNHWTTQEEEWWHLCCHHWIQERSGRQNHLCQQISASPLPLHERGDCQSSGEDYWPRRGQSSWNYSSRTQHSSGGDPGWKYQCWVLKLWTSNQGLNGQDKSKNNQNFHINSFCLTFFKIFLFFSV